MKRTTRWRLALIIALLPLLASADELREAGVAGAQMLLVRRASSGFDGLVIAAPHEGYDSRSSNIVRDMPSRLGAGRVVADGFRSSSRGRFINVNRPTEEPLISGSRGAERETTRARRVYDVYQRTILEAGRRATQLDLLVEIHGNSRKITVGTRERTLETIECATSGFYSSELRSLGSLYENYRRAYDLPPLYFDALPEHRTYSFEGTRVGFYFRASGAKQDGALRPSRARRALHFELPPSVRLDSSKRRIMTQVLEILIQKAWDQSKAR